MLPSEGVHLRPAQQREAGCEEAIVQLKGWGGGAEQVMFVGDHILTDVNVAKATLQWRTVLIMRELEDEVLAMEKGRLAYEEIQNLLKRRARHMPPPTHEFRLLLCATSASSCRSRIGLWNSDRGCR